MRTRTQRTYQRSRGTMSKHKHGFLFVLSQKEGLESIAFSLGYDHQEANKKIVRAEINGTAFPSHRESP